MNTLALIARKPGLSRAAFRAHYEETHAPLGLRVMSGLQRYVRHHVAEQLHGAAGFDVVTSFSYRDAAALHAVIARLATPAGDAVLRDELTFMDKPRNTFFAVRDAGERGARDRAAPLQGIALVKRASAQAASEFRAAFARRALPELHDALRELRWSLHREALASFGEPAFDAVLQFHARGGPQLESWCAAREAEGARVVVVRVSECETPLPPGGLP